VQNKDKYTLRELYDNLPVTLAELGRQAKLNEVTVARIRDGERARRGTANSLLRAMSAIYGREFTLANVTGINVQGSGAASGQDDNSLDEVA